MSNFSPDAGNVLIGAGHLYLSRKINGVLDGEMDMGNCTAFSVTSNVTIKELYSSMEKGRGLLQAAPTTTSFTGKATFSEYTRNNLAYFLAGAESTLTQAQGTVTAEVVTAIAKPGRFYPTKYRNISAVTVHQGATALVAGVDYSVDAVSGRIHVLPTATLTDGTPLTVDYSYAAANLKVVDGGTQGAVEVFIRYVSDNTVGGNTEIQVWRALVTGEGDMGFIGEDFGNFSLNFRILLDTSRPTSPYFKYIEV